MFHDTVNISIRNRGPTLNFSLYAQTVGYLEITISITTQKVGGHIGGLDKRMREV